MLTFPYKLLLISLSIRAAAKSQPFAQVHTIVLTYVAWRSCEDGSALAGERPVP
jgi:hypothetical protein